jgi:ribosomal-protein-alanine N-acetyltransferase
MAVTEWGFRELGLIRIFAVPFAENQPSHRVLEKAGYEREGLLRASAIKDGQIHDQYMYARVSQASLRRPTNER